MSETKFTPGPWVAYPHLRRRNHTEISTDNLSVISIASVYGVKNQKMANARLIAAAPEMYEFGETTAEVLQILLERLGPKPEGLNAEIKRLAEERISEWRKIGKKARGEG